MIVEEILPPGWEPGSHRPPEDARERQLAERNAACRLAFYRRQYGRDLGAAVALLDEVESAGLSARLFHLGHAAASVRGILPSPIQRCVSMLVGSGQP